MADHRRLQRILTDVIFRDPTIAKLSPSLTPGVLEFKEPLVLKVAILHPLISNQEHCVCPACVLVTDDLNHAIQLPGALDHLEAEEHVDLIALSEMRT